MTNYLKELEKMARENNAMWYFEYSLRTASWSGTFSDTGLYSRFPSIIVTAPTFTAMLKKLYKEVRTK
jgi:hypothetical protein